MSQAYLRGEIPPEAPLNLTGAELFADLDAPIRPWPGC